MSFKDYLKLFFNTFRFSCTASNGYAILAQMKDYYVDKEKWTDEETMANYIALAQSAPGPVAVSGSYIIGKQIGGVLGAIVAVTGIILPPMIMMTIVYYAYEFVATNQIIRLTFKGMQAAVCAFIISVTYDNIKAIAKKKSIFLLLVIVLAFIAMKFFNVNVLWVMIVSALSTIVFFRLKTKEQNNG